MSNLNDKFEDSIDQAVKEERDNADRWRQETKDILIKHLYCRCGESFKDKLLSDLLISSTLSFEKFLLYFFIGDQKSNDITLSIRGKANARKVPQSEVLLEYLSDHNFTFTDLINGLEVAYLFRVIAGFNHQSVKDLKEHASSSGHIACCTVKLTSHVEKLVSPRVLHPHYVSGPCRKKAYKGIVLLTFMNDGKQLAKQVKNILENPADSGRLPYLVLTLSDFASYVVENYIRNILFIMSQVDFVVPILTEKYFQMLDDEDVNWTDIDEKYAPYVKQVLLAEWASTFRNKRLRAVKPRGVAWPLTIYPPYQAFVEDPTLLRTILIKSRD